MHDHYKQQAKRLRTALREQGLPVSHSNALELVARSHGYHDWNTLAAPSPERDAAQQMRLTVGDKVELSYVRRPAVGTVLAVQWLTSVQLRRVSIHLDAPVDVSGSRLFSAPRQRIMAMIDLQGRSCSVKGQPNGAVLIHRVVSSSPSLLTA